MKDEGRMKVSRSMTNCLHFFLLLFPLTFTLYPFTSKSNAAEFKEIQQRGYLLVAVKDNSPPLGFRDRQGKLRGLEIELAQKLAADLLGNPAAVKFIPVANRDRLNAVMEDKVDLAIAQVTATDSRSRLVSFSPPYYMDGAAIIAKKATAESLNDVAKKTVAVLKGSSTIPTLKYLLPQVQLLGVDSYQQAHALLESGIAAAFTADASVLSGWVREYPQYEILPTLLSAEPLAVVMPKGLQYDSLRQQVNAAIARYTTTGWLRQRAEFWGLPVNVGSRE
ncbi:transporter substrate-binding domain-containing protein [Chroococcidiopsis sp.]|uniref:transporter substrate-binding domain-containing protein n=1 Tax=Chroococcidiopsis sp. TaxID=3088168 RepID=UPI003F3794BA